MKNKLLTVLIAGALIVLPAISFAQTAISQTIKDEINAKKDALKNSVEERRQNAIGKIIESIGKFVGNIIVRYDATVNRLEIISERLDSRITKMKAQNIDVAKAKELLTTANVKIETAKTSIDNINDNIASSTATSTAELKKEYQDVKAQIEKAKEDIKTAHTSLVDVVNSLKPGQNKITN